VAVFKLHVAVLDLLSNKCANARRCFVAVIISITTLGTSMNVLASSESVSWKEEVLLHDQTKMVVERSQKYTDRRMMVGTERTITEESWIFQIPGAQNKVTWSTGFARPPESSCLMLMHVNFLNDVPYIATSPAGTLAYNHWGRPNPPYVFFKHDGKDWQRVALADYPTQFVDSNVVVGDRGEAAKLNGTTLTIDQVKTANRLLDSYMRQVVRQPVTQGDGVWLSPVMVYDGKGAWKSPKSNGQPAQPVGN
jgi:hypothetical protein